VRPAVATGPAGVPTSVPDRELWGQANRRLLAKMISELAWEGAFRLEPADAEGGFALRLASGVTYAGQAWRSIWDMAVVAPDSLRRTTGGESEPALDVLRFTRDASAEIGLGPADLAIYLRELVQTLIADVRLLELNRHTSANALLALPELDLHARLEGHPKAITSKGRIGWGLDDLRAYAPEFGGTTRLFWLAVRRRGLAWAMAPGIDEDALLESALDGAERMRLEQTMRELGIDRSSCRLVPLHPWQWENVVASWFAPELARGEIVPLGVFGDRFRPQPSLRTLGNADRAVAYDVKLAISILNTSCVRGIPGRYIATGPRLCLWLRSVLERDPVLGREDRVRLLCEVAGAHRAPSLFEGIADAPYHYAEALGVIWRERVGSSLRPGEQALMLSALHHRAACGRTLAEALIQESGLSPEAWLRRLFEVVVVPLYHLLARYGLAPIAHGQNVTLILAAGQPVAIALKDFQGDLDLAEGVFPEREGLPEDVAGSLPMKPPEYIVHNIQTALFVTVLRFLSAALADLVPEMRFYAILGGTLRDHEARHPELEQRFRTFELFAPTLPRVCINRARFELGYAESAARPLPVVGPPLDNPLHLALRQLQP
jgi:aerobactin synthase